MAVKDVDAIVRRGKGGPIVAGGRLLAITGRPLTGGAIPMDGNVYGQALDEGDTSGLIVELAVQPDVQIGP